MNIACRALRFLVVRSCSLSSCWACQAGAIRRHQPLWQFLHTCDRLIPEPRPADMKTAILLAALCAIASAQVTTYELELSGANSSPHT